MNFNKPKFNEDNYYLNNMNTGNSKFIANPRSTISTYERKYGQYLELVSESLNSKYGYEWSDEDTAALGKLADVWESYLPILEGDPTTKNALGAPLATKMDLIAMVYSSMPVQYFASIQPLEDEVGVIYYRSALATVARGGLKPGDVLTEAYGAVSHKISDYVSETQVHTVQITSKSNLTYQGKLAGGKLRKGDVRISVSGGKIKGMDDGEGHILGVGINASTSTINYEDGSFKIVFTDLTTAGVQDNDTLDITYSLSVIESNSIPGMKWTLLSKPVSVQYDVLQSEYSTLAGQILEKKFGTSMAYRTTKDLVSQIKAAVLYRSIKVLRNCAIRNETKIEPITWNSKPASGVSVSEHRATFTDNFRTAVDAMYKLAGIGNVSTIISGYKGLQILDSLGLERLDTPVAGPHLAGRYQGIPVFYAPRSVLNDQEMLVIYRGTNWYEAPVVYAPFLPITVIQGNSVGNVFTSAQGIYHASAIESVQDGFCIRITIS